jgi:hypothetical protein
MKIGVPGSFVLLEASSFIEIHGLFLELKPRNSFSMCGKIIRYQQIYFSSSWRKNKNLASE